MAYSIRRDGNTAHETKEPMQELLQEINARLSRIEKALGIRTPVTIDTSASSVWILCDSATLEPIDPLTWTPHPWPAEPIAPGPGYPEPEEIGAGMAAIEDQETSESKVATPTENRVAKKPVSRALNITYGFKIRHHEPQVREVLVSEPGTRVTNGTKTGTIKAIGDRGIQVLWDGGLRAKWFDGTGFSVV